MSLAKRARASRRYLAARIVGGVKYPEGVPSLSDISYRADQRHFWSLVSSGFVVIVHNPIIENGTPTQEDDLPCYG